MIEETNISAGISNNAEPKTTNNASSRVKRMRGWLGVKSSVETHNLGGSSDILIDVDAPNGWNR